MSLGQLVLVAVPGEFTTMSGRLLRKAVLKVTIQYNNVFALIITCVGTGGIQY